MSIEERQQYLSDNNLINYSPYYNLNRYLDNKINNVNVKDFREYVELFDMDVFSHEDKIMLIKKLFEEDNFSNVEDISDYLLYSTYRFKYNSFPNEQEKENKKEEIINYLKKLITKLNDVSYAKKNVYQYLFEFFSNKETQEFISSSNGIRDLFCTTIDECNGYGKMTVNLLNKLSNIDPKILVKTHAYKSHKPKQVYKNALLAGNNVMANYIKETEVC